MMGFSKPGSGEVKIFGEPTCGFDPVMQERFWPLFMKKNAWQNHSFIDPGNTTGSSS